MQKRTRRVLFWFAVVVFGAASVIAVVYAQGYRFDFSSGQFVRTGAVAVTVNTDATLYVNDEPVGDTTSFLSHRVGDDKLLPGTYALRVEHQGWSSWHKSVQVQEGILADFPAVMLLPADEASQPALRDEIVKALTDARTLADATPTPLPKPKKSTPPTVVLDGFTLRGSTLLRMDTASGSLVAEQVLGFEPADGGNRVMWFTRNEVWVQWFSDTNYQPFRTTGDKQLITRFSVPISRAAWFRDNDHIVVDLGAGSYRVLETDTRGGVNIIRI
jgi:hypothetical protein